MDLHGSFETETVTTTVEPPVLEQQDINVEAHGKRLAIFGDFKRSENHDEAQIYGAGMLVWPVLY